MVRRGRAGAAGASRGREVLAVVLAVAAVLAPVVGGIAVPGGVGTAAADSTLVVDADGGADYTTIQAAVDNASAGDTIEVRAGTYNESVTVNASITIRGSGATLNGTGVNASDGLTIEGGGPTVAGLTIRGFSDDGVFADGGGGFTLDGITVTENGDDGIDVDGDTAPWTIADATVTDNGQNGVEAIATSTDWTIRGGRYANNPDDGLDVAGGTGAWTITGVRIDGSGNNGVEAEFTTGDWRLADAEITNSGEHGVTANASTGNWTVQNVVIDGGGGAGLRATRTTGTWQARGLSVGGVDVGINAFAATRGWQVERFKTRNVVLGIQTDFADGDWTVTDATITASLAGVDATDSDGDWTVTDATITTPGFAGVYAFESDGNWTVAGTTVRDATNGIYARTTDGAWSIRDSTLRNYTVGVNATNTSGAWAVGASVLDASGPNVTDVDGGEGGPTGDATGNWWGGTVAEPDPPVCEGNVDCSDPLSGPPGGDGRTGTGDANLSVSVGSATALPGGNATIDITVEAGDRNLSRAGVFVGVGPSVAEDGWPFVGVTAERGVWNRRSFVVANVSAGETVNASFTLAVPLETPPGRYGITVLPSYVIGDDSTTVAPANATVTVDEPPVSLEGANITLPPGGRGRLNLTVTNNEFSELFASVSIERLPANVSIVEYVGGGGLWVPGSGLWGGDVPADGSLTPALVVEVYDGATEGTSTGRATVARNGTTYDRAPLTVVVDRSAGPTPNVSLNLTVETDSYVNPYWKDTGRLPELERGEKHRIDVTVTNAGPVDAERLEVSLGGLPPFTELTGYNATLGAWRTAENTWVGDLPAGTTTILNATLDIPTILAADYYTITAVARWDGQTIATARREIKVAGDGDTAPEARLSVNDSSPRVGQPVRLDASASSDVDGDPLTYEWDYDDDPSGDQLGPERIVRSFGSSGCYRVSVQVADGPLGDIAKTTIAVGNVSCGGKDGDGTDDTPPVPDNFPPDAAFTFSPGTPLVGEPVSFDASNSADRNDLIVEYAWDLDGDGETDATGKRLTDVVFGTEGDFVTGTRNVTLTVTDGNGATDSVTREVTFVEASDRPTAKAILYPKGNPERVVRGPLLLDQTYVLTPAFSEAGATEIVFYGWKIVRVGEPGPDEVVATTSTRKPEYNFDRAGKYRIELTVRTRNGLTDTDSLTVRIGRTLNIRDVDLEKPGRLIKGIGMQNTLYILTTPTSANPPSATQVDAVKVTFPNGETVSATKVDEQYPPIGERNFGLGVLWSVPFDVADIPRDDETIEIVATNGDGYRDTRTFTVDVVRPPGWWYKFMAGPLANAGNTELGDELRIEFKDDLLTEREYTITNTQTPPASIPGLGFTLGPDAGPLQGTYQSRLLLALYDIEYDPRTGKMRSKKASQAGTRVFMEFDTPFGSTGRIDFVIDCDACTYEIKEDLVASLFGINVDVEAAVGSTRASSRVSRLGVEILGRVTRQDWKTIGRALETPLISVKTGITIEPRVTFGPTAALDTNEGEEVLGVPITISAYAALGTGVEVNVIEGEVEKAPGTEVDPEAALSPISSVDFGLDVEVFPDFGDPGVVTGKVKIGAELCYFLGCFQEFVVNDRFKVFPNLFADDSNSQRLRVGSSSSATAVDGGDGATLGVQPQSSNGSVITRLTEDDRSDRAPDVAAGRNVTVVWQRQASNGSGPFASHVYAATRTNGTWSTSRVTDRPRPGAGPAVGSVGGHSLVAWPRIGTSGTRPNLTVTGSRLMIARSTAEGAWTTPARIDSNASLYLSPEVAGIDTDAGVRWLVAWFVDGDANLSTRSDRSVRYAILDGGGTVRVRGTVAAATGVAVASNATDNGFVLATTRGRGSGTGVVRAELSPDGTVRGTRTYSASNVSALTAAAGRIGWFERRDARRRAFVAGPRGVDRIPLRGVARAGAPELSVSRGVPTLTYRAELGTSERLRPVYQTRNLGTWSSPQPYRFPENVSAQGIAAATGGTELVGVSTASPEGTARGDVFVHPVSIRADLRTNVTATVEGSPEVGAPTTVRYTVENVGARTSGPATAVFRNRTGAVRSVVIGPLGPGERTTGNETFPLGVTGRITVAIDPDDRVAESNESNNADTAIAATPDLDVLGITDRRADDRLEVTVAVRNRGPVPVGAVPFRLTAGNESVTATLRGLGANRTWNRTVTMNASAIDTGASLEVVFDPDDAIAEADETNNGFTAPVLRADVGIVGSATVYDDPQGARAELTVRNSDTGTPTANLTLETPAGTRTYRLTLPAARGPEDIAYRSVSLAIPGIAAGENLTLIAEPGSVDADLGDNAARQSVDRIEPARNASARPLAIANATGRLANGSVVLTLALRNPGNLTTGEVVTVSRDGAVRAREPVAVAPGTGTVRLRPNVTAGTYMVATANDTATVEVASRLPGPPTDPDGDGEFEDVNGDGSANVVDVAVLLDRFDRPAYQNAAAKFDFNDDGRLNIVDVAELLEAV